MPLAPAYRTSPWHDDKRAAGLVTPLRHELRQGEQQRSPPCLSGVAVQCSFSARNGATEHAMPEAAARSHLLVGPGRRCSRPTHLRAVALDNGAYRVFKGSRKPLDQGTQWRSRALATLQGQRRSDWRCERQLCRSRSRHARRKGFCYPSVMFTGSRTETHRKQAMRSMKRRHE